MDNHNIDHDRENRIGFQEVIYGASKTVEDMLSILLNFIEKDKNALITKIQGDKAKILLKNFPNAFYDAPSEIFILKPIKSNNTNEEIGILSAGTSDVHVVNETYYTLKFMGVNSKRFHDIGVAGIHRLLGKVEALKAFKILVVVAGFEGALPTVVGGLLPQPIIAVPTDVGYGVAKGGELALHAMLSSCANGITVVNINNGYGAAMAAIRILNLIKK